MAIVTLKFCVDKKNRIFKNFSYDSDLSSYIIEMKKKAFFDEYKYSGKYPNNCGNCWVIRSFLDGGIDIEECHKCDKEA